MGIRNDDYIEIELGSIEKYTGRAELRKFLLYTYTTEECKTKLRYFVETQADGKRIYIERPGRLNKGCDFVIYVEDLIKWQNGNDKAPSHNDLLEDLQLKKDNLPPNDYGKLIQAITDIHDLKTFEQAYSNVKGLPCHGWPYELTLKLVRWFFIEQDLTYWAGQGRGMLYNAIKEV